MHRDLARGGRNRVTQNDEPAELPQRERKINFLAGEVLLIEAADRLEVFAAREDERSNTKTEREVGRRKHGQENARPERHRPVECDASTAADAASLQSFKRGANIRCIDLRIRVDEE